MIELKEDKDKYKDYPYNPLVEEIVNILVNKTQNQNREFFRLQTNFFLTLIPSSLNIKINSKLTGKIPVNFYGVNLAPSGIGKNFSSNLLEYEILGKFKRKYLEDTYPNFTKNTLEIVALQRTNKNSDTTQEEELEKVEKEFKSYGSYKFNFDSATTPALKQFRHKIILGGIGSLNFIADEISVNLKSNLEPLYTYLELYDKGLVKDKLLKNTAEQERYKELIGQTPCNLLLFGTPTKLFDGGDIEDIFFDLLDMGYARRCFFANGKKELNQIKNIEDLYNLISNENQEELVEKLSSKFERFANVNLVNLEIKVSKEIDIELLKYRTDCENIANKLPEHQAILKAEISHRYFKTLKLAGVYALLSGSTEIKLEHLKQAIKFAEDSGKAFISILNRPKPYERLAKFIADGKGKKYTQVDLIEELPYYKGTITQKQELMNMAIAYGYSNNIIIKKNIQEGIEFYSGDSLEETNLEKLKISYSQYFGDGYVNALVNFLKDFDTLIKQENYNWTNHFLKDGKRDKDHILEGFNCVVLDIDKETTINQAKEILKDYSYIIHTTKRHLKLDEETGKCNDRFRIILPINYELNLTEPDYKQFMFNIEKLFPFCLDSQTFQRSRKWSCNPKAVIFKNEGKLLNILPLVPKTTKEQEFQKIQEKINSLDAIDRWFIHKITFEGEPRNNTLLKYAFMLADSGMQVKEIENRVLNLNKSLKNPLDNGEIEKTIFVSLNKRYGV